MSGPTKRVERLICNALGRGLTLPAAAAKGGIDYTTLWRWRREFLEFDLAVRLALGKGRAALEEKAIKRAPPLKLLAARYPEVWGPRSRVHVDASVKHSVAPSGAEAIAQLESMLRAMRGATP